MKSSIPFFIALIIVGLVAVVVNHPNPEVLAEDSYIAPQRADNNEWDYCGLEAVVCRDEDPVEVIKRVAQEENFDADLLLRLADCESETGKMMIGDTFMPQYSYGLFQINLHYHPNITIEQAMDYEWATRWTINEIKNGRLWKWSCANKI